MLVIVRSGERLSIKTNFISHIISQEGHKVLCIFMKESDKFKAKWLYDEIQLQSSNIGIIAYYLLVMLKSPKNIRDGLMARFSIIKRKQVLTDEGFLSTLSRALYLRLGSSAKASRLMQLLKKLDTPKVFLIDEFLSLNCIDTNKLHLLGPLIYVSQDIAAERFGFGDNFITRNLMFRLERDVISHFDLVVACSERDRLKYMQMGAKKAIFYPNIYPTREFRPSAKDKMPSISIVLKAHWGSKAEESLDVIFNALARLGRQIRVYMIGIRPKRVPRNVEVEYFSFIPSRIEYLKLLSKSWIGINVGIHVAGTNERKYDYAQAGTVIFSDTLGARGDLLPHEYTYIDSYDLTAKMEQILEFGKARLAEMGEENRSLVLSAAEKAREKLLDHICKIIV